MCISLSLSLSLKCQNGMKERHEREGNEIRVGASALACRQRGVRGLRRRRSHPHLEEQITLFLRSELENERTDGRTDERDRATISCLLTNWTRNHKVKLTARSPPSLRTLAPELRAPVCIKLCKESSRPLMKRLRSHFRRGRERERGNAGDGRRTTDDQTHYS